MDNNGPELEQAEDEPDKPDELGDNAQHIKPTSGNLREDKKSPKQETKTHAQHVTHVTHVPPKRYVTVVFGCDNVFALPLLETDTPEKAKEYITRTIKDDVTKYKITNHKYDFPEHFTSNWLNYEFTRLYELPKELWEKLYFICECTSCYYLVGIFTIRENSTCIQKIMQNLYVENGHLHTKCDNKLRVINLEQTTNSNSTYPLTSSAPNMTKTKRISMPDLTKKHKN